MFDLHLRDEILLENQKKTFSQEHVLLIKFLTICNSLSASYMSTYFSRLWCLFIIVLTHNVTLQLLCLYMEWRFLTMKMTWLLFVCKFVRMFLCMSDYYSWPRRKLYSPNQATRVTTWQMYVSRQTQHDRDIIVRAIKHIKISLTLGIDHQKQIYNTR